MISKDKNIYSQRKMAIRSYIDDLYYMSHTGKMCGQWIRENEAVCKEIWSWGVLKQCGRSRTESEPA